MNRTWRMRAGLIAVATMAIFFLVGSIVGIRRIGGAGAAALGLVGFVLLVLLFYGVIVATALPSLLLARALQERFGADTVARVLISMDSRIGLARLAGSESALPPRYLVVVVREGKLELWPEMARSFVEIPLGKMTKLSASASDYTHDTLGNGLSISTQSADGRNVSLSLKVLRDSPVEVFPSSHETAKLASAIRAHQDQKG